MEKINKIIEAIEGRFVIQFNYEGQTRVVEPFVLGIHKDTGNYVLRAYRVGGYSKSNRELPWRLFVVSEITGLIVTKNRASSSREFYNPNDKHMSKIIRAA